MNKRERYLAAAHRQGVDRIPTLFRSSKVLARRLMAHFGLDPTGELASAQALLAQLGADCWASGSRIGYYSTFVPKYTGSRPQPPHVEDAAYFFTLGIPAVTGEVAEYGFDYPAYVAPPLAGAEAPTDIPTGYLTRRLAWFDFDCMVNRHAVSVTDTGDPLTYEALRHGGEIICIGILNNLYMICCYLRGMEQFLMDLAWNRPLAERLIAEVGDFCLEFTRRQLTVFGDKADFYGSWDDVAGQDSMMFAPKLFRSYYFPLYRQLIAEVKRHNTVYSFHCCGSVHQVLPMMIDAGIDVFDVVQTSARDMDLEIMYRRYGQDVCLSGGIDVQKLLVSGTPAEVRSEVRRAHDLWGTRGALVLGPSHEAAPETPLNNILAIYEPV